MTLDYSNMFDLSGKVAVITGGGGGLCGAMSTALATLGVKVAILDVNADTAQEVANKITDDGGQALSIKCNVLDAEELDESNNFIRQNWGEVDFLICGAGGNDPRGNAPEEFLIPNTIGSIERKSFFDIDLHGFRHVFDLNFISTYMTIQAFSKAMVNRGRGSIINMSSMSALTPLTQVGAYSAAKAAVSNFTQWLAVHLSKTGVRVNALAPGFFMTEQVKFLHIDKKTGELSKRAKNVISHTPLGRYGEPEDLIGAIVWLLSDASSFVTGSIIVIDGGFSSYTI